MAFEETLKQASLEYLESTEKLSTADVAALFNHYFYVLGATEHEGKHTITLPGPELCHRRYGGSNSSYWLKDVENPQSLAGVRKRLELWPQGSGKDGLIYLNFKKGDGFDIHGRDYVEIQFDTYLTIPNNQVEDEIMRCLPSGGNGSMLNARWVTAKDGSSEIFYNASEHGRIRYIITEGFGRFRRSPTPEDEKPDEIPGLIMWIPSASDGVVRSVTPRIITEKEKREWGDIEHHLKYSGAQLGDGAVNAFLKHMQYDGEIGRIVR
ncbi:TPA: hypothetical protein HA234_00905 [Candidatus Woesearchaeota archaeon]|nr:hypothetical protein [Candidatus Woesearchaeota archaeon]